MSESQFTGEQLTFAPHQAEAGTRAAEACREVGIAQAAVYNCTKKHGGLGVAEMRRACAVLEFSRTSYILIN